MTANYGRFDHENDGETDSGEPFVHFNRYPPFFPSSKNVTGE